MIKTNKAGPYTAPVLPSLRAPPWGKVWTVPICFISLWNMLPWVRVAFLILPKFSNEVRETWIYSRIDTKLLFWSLFSRCSVTLWKPRMVFLQMNRAVFPLSLHRGGTCRPMGRNSFCRNVGQEKGPLETIIPPVSSLSSASLAFMWGSLLGHLHGCLSFSREMFYKWEHCFVEVKKLAPSHTAKQKFKPKNGNLTLEHVEETLYHKALADSLRSQTAPHFQQHVHIEREHLHTM